MCNRKADGIAYTHFTMRQTFHSLTHSFIVCPRPFIIYAHNATERAHLFSSYSKSIRHTCTGTLLFRCCQSIIMCNYDFVVCLFVALCHSTFCHFPFVFEFEFVCVKVLAFNCCVPRKLLCKSCISLYTQSVHTI